MSSEGPPTTASEQFRRQVDVAKAGSTEVLGQLLELCRDYLLGVANAELESALLPKGGASDLVQESFLEAHRVFARFEGGSDRELLAWLRGILLNKLSEFRRHYQATAKRRVGRESSLDERAAGPGSSTPAAPDPTPSALLARDEDAEAVRQALERLPEHYREVIVWREWEGLGFEEIGRRSGRTADASRMIFWRAVARLEQELGASPPGRA